MIVWGGYGGDYLRTGGRYDPEADAWSSTLNTGAPSKRVYHTAIWTGTKMVVWGGYNGSSPLDTGGRYAP
jgi:N-acetylneuraminic acid mutarotase